jgi:hypothetical protein
MIVHSVILAIQEAERGGLWSEASPGKKTQGPI